MHESNNSEILWYIDTINYGNILTLRGWILHFTQNIQKLSINEEDLNFTPYSREDVEQVYPNANFVTGFEIKVREEIKHLPVQVHLTTGEVITIESLEKFLIFYSGFNEGNKNLVVVDDFYYNPDEVREFAINNLDFNNSNYHKGKRSKKFILNGTKEKLEEILGRKILNWDYEGYANGVFQYCTASDPIVYHVDTQQFAGVVFLTPDAPLEAGTATYKSKITNKFRLDGDDSAYEETFKGRSESMNFYDATTYELVDRVANVYNRLVLWDAKTIHAATAYFGDNINNSRFFHLFFFDVE